MGRELTKRYAGLIQGKRWQNPLAFLYDVYRSKKMSEFASFTLWEILHRLRLFPKSSYLPLAGEDLVSLTGEPLSDPDYNARLDRFFAARGMRLERCPHNWKVMFTAADGVIYGCTYPDDTALYKSVDGGESITLLERFPERIKSIFVSSRNTIFVSVLGAVFRSPDAGASFTKALDMGSPVSFFRHNNGMTETPGGALVVAEYGNIWTERGWEKLAYIYVSSDDGESWRATDFLIQGGTNKHVHLVKYSELFDKVFMADGDNYKKLWMTRALTGEDLLKPERWEPWTRFHVQTGGYTAVVESEEKILFGTDYQGGTNFLVESADGRTFRKRVVPDPYRRSPIMNMVRRRSGAGEQIWAYLPYSTARTKCLLMYSADGGEAWQKVVDYLGDKYKLWMINATSEAAGEVADPLYFSIEDLRNGDRVVYRVQDA